MSLLRTPLTPMRLSACLSEWVGGWMSGVVLGLMEWKLGHLVGLTQQMKRLFICYCFKDWGVA